MIISHELSQGSSSSSSLTYDELSQGSSSSSSLTYDVFLSFRGIDTRLNFTNHLHKALEDANLITFLDDQEIDTTLYLKPELESAIKASRSSIIVLSKNYASSTRCLEELVLILEQHKTSSQMVFPIFYHVNPTDVGKQQNSFGDAMERHKQRMEAETNVEEKSLLAQKMVTWKKALTEVTDLEGIDAKGRLETEFIEAIVTDIKRCLGVPLWSTLPDLIGMDCSVRFISSWLKDGSTHTADILTILGMDGIGKTSLAKYVYDMHHILFNRSSFVVDINRKCRDEYDKLRELQMQVLVDISETSSEQIPAQFVSVYTSNIEKALARNKVLLVLDDIDSLDQLNVLLGGKGFHPGSKIIITTKDASLARRYKLSNPLVQPNHTTLSLEGLNETSSLQLLSFHAFKRIGPTEGYKQVCKKLLKFCERLPLVLKVLGCSLCDQDVAEWEEYIGGLEHETDSTYIKVLQMSFDSLPSQNDKELFKHIACFFVGMDRDYTETILKACGIRTLHGIRNLLDRCLLVIGPRNELMMHQLLQDMGKDMVCKESLEEPWKRSRLWCHKDSFNVLQQKKGKGSLKGIVLDMRMLEKENLHGSLTLRTYALSKMDNLMLLQLNYVQLKGSYKNFPKQLRWLCMHGFPSPSIPFDLQMENLVALDMSYSKIKNFDMSCSNMKQPSKPLKLTGHSKDKRLLGSLKILNLSFCEQLHSLGGFIEFPALERLIVTNCIDLTEVSESIEQCVELVIIDLSYCKKLEKLPKTLEKLKKVKKLLLHDCNLRNPPTEMRDRDSQEMARTVPSSLEQYNRNVEERKEQEQEQKELERNKREENERKERERIEQDYKRDERERIEQECIKREENERKERERIEQERIKREEDERKEWERIEQERIKREEKERNERELRVQERNEREESERNERNEQEEREQLLKDLNERMEQQRIEQQEKWQRQQEEERNQPRAPDKQTECCSTHLIDGDGIFNEAGLNYFIKQVKMGELGLSYAVVSIMGPQSSGKSTLMNHLFRTNFKEMIAHDGRSQTTLGVWMAKCNDIEPCTIIMDLEGNDGRERGEDNTAFEKQIALFALAVSDIVLINMWCNDIGREQASNKALLRTIFQVMLQLFTPRKTTLMFVIRDKTDTPLEKLESLLREDTQKIWDAIPKPEAHKQTPLSDFFNIQVEALSHYKYQKEEFEKEVAIFRKKFFKSIEAGGLAGDRRGAVPASAFSVNVQNMWKVIKENKDLDLTAHKVFVANIRCEEIANDKYSIFVANKEWLELKELVKSKVVPGFGKKLSSLLAMSLTSYDKEATYFDESGKNAKRKQLQDRLIQLAQPTIKLMLEHITSETLKNFKKELNDALIKGQGISMAARYCTQKFMTLFDEQCQDIVIEQEKWDFAKVRDTFSAKLASHILEVRTANLSKLTALYETKLEEALNSPVEVLLKGGSDNTWHEIRNLLHSEIERAVSEFSSAISSFDFNEEATKGMISDLKNYASGLVEGKAREEAAKVLYHVKERFIFIFNHENDSKTRVWTDKEDIKEITKNAHSACLTLLSVLAAIRLDNGTDTIREKLFLAWDPETSQIAQHTLASSTWEKIPATKTLVTPVECVSVWNQFRRETEYCIIQATASQETYKQAELDHKPRGEREGARGVGEVALNILERVFLPYIYRAFRTRRQDD